MSFSTYYTYFARTLGDLFEFREPGGVHTQLEGCNRNLRPKAAVANKSNLAPNVFLNFVQNASFSIVLNF